MTDISAPHLHPVSATKRPQIDPALKAAATELEAAFLAEMLKSAGLGQAREAMGGGAGEAQFASLLATEHAKALAKAGGIGLAEQFMASLARAETTHDT
ncbi:MAG: rod-binding protein [Rhodobacteraceae bacterium]|nr:rod-binding protein [Paracoccaceae bacterium]